MTDTATFTVSTLDGRVLVFCHDARVNHNDYYSRGLWWELDVATAAGLARDLMVAAAEAAAGKQGSRP